jgi:hypothetical protein
VGEGAEHDLRRFPSRAAAADREAFAGIITVTFVVAVSPAGGTVAA